MYIVVEGLEGAGKSTILSFIVSYLDKQLGDGSTIMTREPGGTPVAEQMRNLAKYPDSPEDVHDLTELFLMYGARCQLHHNVIRPNLEKGKIVVSDRGDLSSQAYQGAGRGLKKETELLAGMVVPDYNPDLTVYLDIDPVIGLKRARTRSDLDRIEQNAIEFFHTARARFLQEVEDKENVKLVDASKTILDVKYAVKDLLDDLLLTKGLKEEILLEEIE